MPSTILNHARTSGLVLGAYLFSAVAAFSLLGPSTTWLVVLGLDFILLAICAMLASMVAGDEQREARIAVLAVAIGTVAPVCVQALKYGLQLVGGVQVQLATESVFGAAINSWAPQHGPIIYLVVLIAWAVLSLLIAVITALSVRGRPWIALWAAMLLLTVATLFLLPWFGGGARIDNPVPTLLRFALAAVSITATMVIAHVAIWTLIHTARVAKAMLPVLCGIALALTAVAVLSFAVISLVHLAGPMLGIVRAIAAGMFWFAIACVAFIGGATLVVHLSTWVATLLSVIAQAAYSIPNRLRWSIIGSLAALLLLALFWPHEPIRPPPPPPPAPVHIEFEEASLACARFRWEYGETDRVTAPASACNAYERADLLIAIGSATRTGGPAAEHARALQRGRTLADAIARNRGDEDAMRVYVLNRGIETPPLGEIVGEAPRLGVLAGTIVPTGSSASDDIIARDLARYLRENPSGSTYSLCDLLPYPALNRTRQLDCSDR